jgi:hypothetical protein
VELTGYERPETIGRPLVDTLRAPAKELRATNQIRLVFTWEYDEHVILFLDADRKKNGHVDEAVVERALRYRDEWLHSRSSRPLDLGEI